MSAAVRLRDRNLVGKIDVLDRMEDLHALGHGPLKRLATRDEPSTPTVDATALQPTVRVKRLEVSQNLR